jgi:hypothetical protein
MNITRELGSFISGLFAPQASTSVQRLGKGATDRSRTTTRNQTENQATTGTAQGSDRLTLSSESISLANISQERVASDTATSPANHIQTSELLALPYSPSTTAPSRQQTDQESPATRQLVRSTYGNVESLSTAESFANPTRIDLHA